MLLPALAVTVALVVQDQAPLRAAAHDNAPRQTALTAGDWLEVRGEQRGFLQVYDHRRERPGYVRPSTVRSYVVDETAAPRLGTLVEYLRDAPGEESLGIGYVALFLRAAPAQQVGAEVFDALGTMAERLGRRASARVAKAGDGSLAAQLEVAESYGVHFVSFEQEGRTRVCYDGEAFRHVLALGGTGPARIHAALGVTDPGCVDPALGQTAALELAKWRAGVLDGVDPAKLGPDVTDDERARLRLRRSTVQAELAYLAARNGDLPLAKQASETAKHELQLTDRSTLADEDRLTYEEAALRTATVRWADEPPTPPASAGLDVELAAGGPGQTCVRVKKHGAAPTAASVVEHCTYGVVWPSSVRMAPHDSAVALIVQPLSGWSELLVLHPVQGTWTADTIAPATIDPDIGYVELAGFSPDGAHLLLVRESRASGPLGAPHTLAPWMQRTFQLVAMSDLRVEKEASSLANFATFRRWETADWKRGTLALR
ncbi:MAG: hypothetical protein ACLQVI_14455 [Polyangiaceae bacterium]